jgi:hypothetical protein
MNFKTRPPALRQSCSQFAALNLICKIAQLFRQPKLVRAPETFAHLPNERYQAGNCVDDVAAPRRLSSRSF